MKKTNQQLFNECQAGVADLLNRVGEGDVDDLIEILAVLHGQKGKFPEPTRLEMIGAVALQLLNKSGGLTLLMESMRKTEKEE